MISVTNRGFPSVRWWIVADKPGGGLVDPALLISCSTSGSASPDSCNLRKRCSRIRLPKVSDKGWRRIHWRDSTDRRLARAAGAGDVQDFGKALRTHAGFSRKVRGRDRLSENCDVFLQPLWSLRALEGASDEQLLPSLLKLLAETRSKLDRKTATRISKRIISLLEAFGAEAPDSPSFIVLI